MVCLTKVHINPGNVPEDSTFFTFISHTLHFIDSFLAILLSEVFGFLHRFSQEFLKLGSDHKEMQEKVYLLQRP